MVRAAEAVDEAQYVRTVDVSDLFDLFLVWHGGTTVNLYQVTHEEGHNWIPRGTFSVSDEKGRPLSQAEMEEQMEQYVEIVETDYREGL